MLDQIIKHLTELYLFAKIKNVPIIKKIDSFVRSATQIIIIIGQIIYQQRCRHTTRDGQHIRKNQEKSRNWLNRGMRMICLYTYSLKTPMKNKIKAIKGRKMSCIWQQRLQI